MSPAPNPQPQAPGTVFLVGAGPGDPGLLTVRAADLLKRCSCVVHDQLVNPALLALAPADAERHDVGKRGGESSTAQETINALLLEVARRHRLVVRLKGGDPFLFGRGGEEAQALREAGIPFAVVPGVTSGIAVPAYAGIPITHRAAASAVAFATGHRLPGKDDAPHWAALARVETIVLYMGMHRLAEIAEALIANGRAAGTPAAVVQWGTYARQRVAEGTLADIAARAAAAGLGAPAIAVIGDVVRYRERIRWFDNRPLFGRRVVVTRAREQASGLAALLADAGAEVVECPLVRQAPPESWGQLDLALAGLAAFTWVAFTSANAVDAVMGRLRALGRDARAFAGCRIAAVGEATDRALGAHGLRADLVPASFSGAELAREILQASPVRPVVLLPQADNAAPALREALVRGGAEVSPVTAYRNLPVAPMVDLVAERPDAVCFASSGTAERFAAALGDGVAALRIAGCRFYAIGPETAATMATLGLAAARIAPAATVAALAETVVADLGTTTDG